MTFKDFVQTAWRDHAAQSLAVAERLEGAFALIESGDDIPPMANLIAHVMGVHLAQWDRGLSLLAKLESVSACSSVSREAIQRAKMDLQVASGRGDILETASVSLQIRSLTFAAMAMTEQKALDKAQAFFEGALAKAQLGLTHDDPANQSLAMTGNNLACALEEVTSRTQGATQLMLVAAQTARKYWAIAGGWLQISRAEYRLAHSCRHAAQLEKALEHAQLCLEVAKENGSPPLEMFFGYEALARVEHACDHRVGFDRALKQMEAYFVMLSPDDRAWCEASLKALKVL